MYWIWLQIRVYCCLRHWRGHRADTSRKLVWPHVWPRPPRPARQLVLQELLLLPGQPRTGQAGGCGGRWRARVPPDVEAHIPECRAHAVECEVSARPGQGADHPQSPASDLPGQAQLQLPGSAAEQGQPPPLQGGLLPQCQGQLPGPGHILDHSDLYISKVPWDSLNES